MGFRIVGLTSGHGNVVVYARCDEIEELVLEGIDPPREVVLSFARRPAVCLLIFEPPKLPIGVPAPRVELPICRSTIR